MRICSQRVDGGKAVAVSEGDSLESVGMIALESDVGARSFAFLASPDPSAPIVPHATSSSSLAHVRAPSDGRSVSSSTLHHLGHQGREGDELLAGVRIFEDQGSAVISVKAVSAAAKVNWEGDVSVPTSELRTTLTLGQLKARLGASFPATGSHAQVRIDDRKVEATDASRLSELGVRSDPDSTVSYQIVFHLSTQRSVAPAVSRPSQSTSPRTSAVVSSAAPSSGSKLTVRVEVTLQVTDSGLQIAIKALSLGVEGATVIASATESAVSGWRVRDLKSAIASVPVSPALPVLQDVSLLTSSGSEGLFDSSRLSVANITIDRQSRTYTLQFAVDEPKAAPQPAAVPQPVSAPVPRVESKPSTVTSSTAAVQATVAARNTANSTVTAKYAYIYSVYVRIYASNGLY